MMTQRSKKQTQPQTGSRSLRRELLRQRYLLKDSSGRVVETPRQMLQRVADAVAGVETCYGASPSEIRMLSKKFRRIMGSGRFVPNSPTLMNAGRDQGACCACYVLPIGDSIDEIFEGVKQAAQVQKAGGGTGFALDLLRPTGDIIASNGGRTSGPISFWRVLAETTRAIQQGASRRGANMAMVCLEYPDILKFIEAKNEPGAFDNFNVSVKITHDFMEKLDKDPHAPHVVVNPRNSLRHVIPKNVDIKTYAIQDLPSEGACDVPCYSRQDLWNTIVANAHATGEPGVCFIDRVNEDNPVPGLGRIEAANPCGEQPLLDYEACNLGSINLGWFVRCGATDLDWDALGRTVRLTARFLDNVVDLTHYPTPLIRARSLGNRKIGLGVMGFANVLILLGLRYDSREAVDFGATVSAFIQDEAHLASQDLASRRGTFPNWQASIWYTDHALPMRNAAVTTIAPTGSISILAGCSSGIEPVFSLAYVRRALDGQQFVEVHPLLEKLGRRGGWMTDDVRDALVEGVPAAEIPAIPQSLAKTLVTAHMISPEWHVRMQAAFQNNVDNAVSKTVNLPAEAPPEDVDKVFRMAFRLGCKGVTVYRDGSREGQTLSTVGSDTAPAGSTALSPRPRSRITMGRTSKFRMGCGTLFVTVNRDEKGLCEVFANLGKAGGCPAQSEATCRAVSISLRSGVAPEVLIEQLKGIRCLSAARARGNGNGVNVLSCPDAIAGAIEEAMGRASVAATPEVIVEKTCPDCGRPLRKESGCLVCQSCGYSNCG